jgi:hypothetical protein
MKLNYEKRVELFGRWFTCRMFYSDKQANLFMTVNPGWGVLKVVERTIYVADNKYLGGDFK